MENSDKESSQSHIEEKTSSEKSEEPECAAAQNKSGIRKKGWRTFTRRCVEHVRNAIEYVFPCLSRNRQHSRSGQIKCTYSRYRKRNLIQVCKARHVSSPSRGKDCTVTHDDESIEEEVRYSLNVTDSFNDQTNYDKRIKVQENKRRY